MPKPHTWVIKLGGSLIGAEELRAWIDHIARASNDYRIVVVPGGGVFADAVRVAQGRIRFDDELAHALALRAMRQFAEVLVNLGAMQPEFRLAGVEEIAAAGHGRGGWIWDPLDASLVRCPLPRDWRATSDSLSLWVCEQFERSELLLIKSTRPTVARATVEQLAAEQFVDAYFPTLWRSAGRRVWWLERSESPVLSGLLAGRDGDANLIAGQGGE